MLISVLFSLLYFMIGVYRYLVLAAGSFV